MGKTKSSHGGVLVWLGIGFLCVASIADVLIIFIDNYSKYLLLTVVLWFAGFACFILAGHQESKKKKQRRSSK